MSSSCLSAATIVRCETLSKLEDGVIFIPVILQVLILIGLTAAYWRSGKKKHLMILADSFAFYVLALLDLLSHLIPEARIDLQFFKIFDIIIGILSFIPILLYAVFLYILARTYFLPTLTRLPRKLTNYTLLAFIPVTIALNELGSFLGINYRVEQDAVGQSFLAIGFSSSSNQSLWQFFTSVTLVLLIVFQATIFCFTIYLAIFIFRERRVRRSYVEDYNPPTGKGIAWVSLGVKLGAIETVLGFVSDGVSVVLARRILRMFSRVCLAIGSLQCERATISQPPAHRRGRTMSQIRAMIANPRASTFARLSPTFTNVYAYSLPQGASNASFGDREAGAAGIHPTPRPQRVTVQYDGRTPPALALRLSGLHLPPAEELTDAFNRRGTLMAVPRSAPSVPASFSFSSMRGMRGHADNGKASSSGSMPRSLSAIAPPSGPVLDTRALPGDLEAVRGGRGREMEEAPGIMSSRRPNPKYFPDNQAQPQSYYQDIGGVQRDIEHPQDVFAGGHSHLMSVSSLASESMSNARRAPQFPGVSGHPLSFERSRPSQAPRDALGGSSRGRGDMGSEKGPSPSGSIKRKPPPSVPRNLEAGYGEGSVPFGGDTVTASVMERAPSDSQRSLGGRSKTSQTSSGSTRRKAMPVPPPIDATIAGPNTGLSEQVQITATSPTARASDKGGRSKYPYIRSREGEFTPKSGTSGGGGSRWGSAGSAGRTQTPGMTLASGTSPATTDIPSARDRGEGGSTMPDPFLESDNDDGELEYRASELAEAESGLGRIAARVAQFDRQRRQSFRGVGRISPGMYSAPARDQKGKGKERVYASTEAQVSLPGFVSGSRIATSDRPRTISRPRQLSAASSASSIRTTTTGTGVSPHGWAPTLASARREHITPAWRAPAQPEVVTRTHTHTFSNTSNITASSAANALERHAERERELVRIKSVGRVWTRQTPTPSTSSFAARRSLRIESGDYSASDYAITDQSAANSPLRLPRTFQEGQEGRLESTHGDADEDDPTLAEGRGWTV
ncbi:hypothetical protein EW145_g5446 [Phellinidium pouzarii]|uniref:Uncharacterized protein n=1 Tax=Phellinidium pouzarii TaxID=167371 RepID=A0A4S4L059_9AGAM|nr:hypothetical protein EW145_g5446 [Phellinidium pouzarii]